MGIDVQFHYIYFYGIKAMIFRTRSALTFDLDKIPPK